MTYKDFHIDEKDLEVYSEALARVFAKHLDFIGEARSIPVGRYTAWTSEYIDKILKLSFGYSKLSKHEKMECFDEDFINKKINAGIKYYLTKEGYAEYIAGLLGAYEKGLSYYHNVPSNVAVVDVSGLDINVDIVYEAKTSTIVCMLNLDNTNNVSEDRLKAELLYNFLKAHYIGQNVDNITSKLRNENEWNGASHLNQLGVLAGVYSLARLVLIEKAKKTNNKDLLKVADMPMFDDVLASYNSLYMLKNNFDDMGLYRLPVYDELAKISDEQFTDLYKNMQSLVKSTEYYDKIIEAICTSGFSESEDVKINVPLLAYKNLFAKSYPSVLSYFGIYSAKEENITSPAKFYSYIKGREPKQTNRGDWEIGSLSFCKRRLSFKNEEDKKQSDDARAELFGWVRKQKDVSLFDLVDDNFLKDALGEDNVSE